MSNKNFDDELANLYQQRRANIDAPEVDLSRIKQRKQYPFMKWVIASITGGFASFGIFAYVNYLASNHTNVTPVTSESLQTTTVILAPAKEDTKEAIPPVTPVQPLPELPETSRVQDTSAVAPEQSQLALEIDTFEVQATPPSDLAISEIAKPSVEYKPIRRVMPKYDRESRLNKSTGTVRLSYRVDNNGSVYDVQVLERKATRGLVASSQKAIKQWQYAPNLDIARPLEVVFEFQL